MKLGRFLSITEIEQTIQQFFETDWWVAYLASVMAAHNADPAAHPGLGVVPCLWLTATNFSLPRNVDTPIAWDTEVLDAEDFWAIGDPTHINIPVAKKGLYLASLYLYIPVDHLGNWLLTVFDFDPAVAMDYWIVPNVDSESTTRATHLPILGATAGQICLLSDQYASTETIGFAELILSRLKAW